MKNKVVKKVILKLVAGVLLVVGLTGCKEAEGTTPEATSSEAVSEVESEVMSEEVAEDVSEEVVSEEAKEEVNEMPEIVDGVQVVYYDTWEELYEYVGTIDETVIVMFSFNHSEKGQPILYNGAHCTIEEDFAIVVKSPKTITSITSEKGSVLVSDSDYEGIHEWDVGLYEVGTDIEVPLVITYEDGTEENFTVYITKDWKYPWEE